MASTTACCLSTTPVPYGFIDSYVMYITSIVVTSDAHKLTFLLEFVDQMRNRARRKKMHGNFESCRMEYVFF